MAKTLDQGANIFALNNRTPSGVPPLAATAFGLLDRTGEQVASAAEGGLGHLKLSEIATAADTLLPSESGKTIYLNLAGGFTLTLPTPALGLHFEFIVKTAPTTAYIIAAAAGDIIVGHVLSSDLNAASDGDLETTAGADTIQFAANKAVIGDRVSLQSDGTYWYATAHAAVFDGITFEG